jgi:hypothetical protein
MPDIDSPPEPETVVAIFYCGKKECHYDLRSVYLDRRGDTYIIINGERRVRTKVLCHICGTFTEFRSVYAPELRSAFELENENAPDNREIAEGERETQTGL